MDQPRLVKALWPPALGWVPVFLFAAILNRIPRHDLGILGIPFVTSCTAVVCCVVNAVRVAGWRDLPWELRCTLVTVNLSFPLGVAAFV